MSRSREVAKATAVSLKEQNAQYEHDYAVKMYRLWENKYRNALNAGKNHAAHQAKARLDYWVTLI